MAVKLLNIMSGSITFENILFIRVLEWLVFLVGYKIKGINEVEVKENLKINWSDYAHYNSRGLKSTLKSPSRKIDCCSLEIFSNNLFK